MSRLDSHKADFAKALDHFKTELGGLRSGRATSALIENVIVTAYGSQTPLKQLGSISVSDTRTLLVEPWDKSILKDVEKGLQAANLGVGVAVDGPKIRVSIPSMTEESRREFVRVLKDKTEQARIAVRGVRDGLKDMITSQEKAGEIREDDRYQLLKELDELTGEYNTQIKDLADRKEEEIMTV